MQITLTSEEADILDSLQVLGAVPQDTPQAPQQEQDAGAPRTPQAAQKAPDNASEEQAKEAEVEEAEVAKEAAAGKEAEVAEEAKEAEVAKQGDVPQPKVPEMPQTAATPTSGCGTPLLGWVVQAMSRVPVCLRVCAHVKLCVLACTSPNGGVRMWVPPIPGWGEMMLAGISAIQILCENFVRNLFGGFKDLCRYMLGIASAHCFS